MKKLVIILSALLLVGCATRLMILEHDKDGKVTRTIEAEDYSIKTPTLTAVPSRWLTPDFVGTIIAGAIKWQSLIPLPAPTPTPAPGPYPAPVPTPTPVPVPPVPTPVTPPTPGPMPPVPVPVPVPLESAVFVRTENVIMFDLEKVPGAMNKIGIPGGANELWYSLAHVFAYGPAREMVSELHAQNPYRQKIFDWFMAETMTVVALMKANPALTLVAISNDGKDRCGFRLGPAILEVMAHYGLGNRVQLGQVMNPDDY